MFITLCYEGGDKEQLDALWERAKDSGETDQIFEAVDAHGNTAF